jgi:hypothetical protein
MKRRHGRGRVRAQHAPTEERGEGFVEVHDVGFEVLDRSSRVSCGPRRQRQRRAAAVGRDLQHATESRHVGGRVVGRVVVTVGRDDHDVVAAPVELSTRGEDLLLHATEGAQGVGRHDGDAHVTHSRIAVARHATARVRDG